MAKKMGRPPGTYSRYIHLKAEPELTERLKRASKHSGVPYSKIVRDCVLAGLSHFENMPELALLDMTKMEPLGDDDME